MIPGWCKKGSLWRRWDFHVHTPASRLSTDYGSDWDIYVYKLVSAAYLENISALGITDYFSVEGYKKLCTEYFKNELKLSQLFGSERHLYNKAKDLYIFPNIEFRLNTFVGANSVNYHVIFSEDVSVVDIEENFLGDLNFAYSSKPQEQSLHMKIKKQNLEMLGQRVRKDQPSVQGSDLVIGLMNAVVSADDIKDVLRRNASRFEGKYLTGLPPDEDLSDVQWDGRDGDVRRQLVGGVDFLFTSNASTRKWALGKKTDSKKQFLSEFHSLKPCIWGSDSHSYLSFLKPTQNRFCWVKADLNFNGLKQIKYEPESRVFIGPMMPDQKNEYYTISRARFCGDEGSKLFSPNWIEINPNLTTIIGGKSSGKSLFLYYLAKTISPIEAKKLVIPGQKFPYDCESVDGFDFEVEWSDGEINKFSSPIDDRKKKITYLPQLYINSLVEGKSRRQLDSLIENVLLENESYASERNKFDLNCSHVDASIEASVSQLLINLEQKQKSVESLARLGDKNAHNNQVEQLKGKIAVLTKESSLSAEEQADLTRFRSEHSFVSSTLRKIENDKLHFDTLRSSLTTEAYESVSSFIMSGYENAFGLSTPSAEFEKFIENFKGILAKDLSETFVKLSSLVDFENKKLSVDEVSNRKVLTDLIEKLRPFSGKFKNREELSKQEEQLKSELASLSQINVLENKIKNLDLELALVKERIWSSRKKYRDTCSEFISFIKSIGLGEVGEDVDLMVDIVLSGLVRHS